MSYIKPKILTGYGVISHDTENGAKWVREVNLISWGETGEPKLDIRAWSKDHQLVGKGIALSLKEEEALLEILEARRAERENNPG